MRTRLIAAIIGGLALVAVGVSPASAAVPWTGTSTTSVTVGPVSCTSSTLSGLATAVPSGPLNTVTSSTFTGCSGSATVTPSGTWTFTGATLTGVHFHVTTQGCAFDLTGAISYTYTASTQTLILSSTPGLTVSGVTGALCAVIPVHNGDHYAVSGSYHVT